jgi:peptidoglycan/xylan/chitin deacetylase (PgdA/CDA1 family)
MSGAIPILMYHLVSPNRIAGFEKYTVAPENFAAQMKWLTRTGYTSIALDTLLDARSGGGALPPKPVVITFDDGYLDCIDHALPVLREWGAKAIIYLVAGRVGGTSDWLIRERGVELPLMGWSAAQKLKELGVECGSHGMTHPRLAEISTEACRYELCESRQRLEERLGYEIKHLAFPHGSYNAGVQRAAREAGYRSCCSVGIGLSRPDDDLLALHRVPVEGQDTLLDFICRLHTAQSLGALVRVGFRARAASVLP